MTALRKLNVNRRLTGFWDGLSKGMASSVEAFDVPTLPLRTRDFAGLRLDVEAIRSDVGRATAKITGSIQKSR